MQASFLSRIFSSNGSTKDLHLCRKHDIEFFKIGQFRFLAKYKIKVKEEDNDQDENNGLQFEDIA